jgi:transposase
MWTCENRSKYNRDKLHYASDLTDEEWSHVASLIPPAKHGGRKRKVDVREVVNGIMYVLSTGCQWRYVPKDLPAKSTLVDYFDLWSYDGTLENIHYALYVKCREAMGRETSPTTCVIDSQRVKGAEKGRCIDPNGYDAGEKIKGKNVGLFLHTVVHLTDVQDRYGGFWFSRLCSVYTHSCVNCSPIAAIKERNFARPRRKPCRNLATEIVKWFGSRRRFRGVAPAVGHQAILRMTQPLPPLGQEFRKSHPMAWRPSFWPPSASCYESSVLTSKLSEPILRKRPLDSTAGFAMTVSIDNMRYCNYYSCNRVTS